MQKVGGEPSGQGSVSVSVYLCVYGGMRSQRGYGVTVVWVGGRLRELLHQLCSCVVCLNGRGGVKTLWS